MAQLVFPFSLELVLMIPPSPPGRHIVFKLDSFAVDFLFHAILDCGRGQTAADAPSVFLHVSSTNQWWWWSCTLFLAAAAAASSSSSNSSYIFVDGRWCSPGANVLAWTSSLFCSIACYNNRVVFKSFVELQEGEKNKLANMYRHSGTHLVGRVCMCSSFLCFLGESGCEGLIAETWKTLCLTCFIRHKLMMRQIPLLVLLPSWRCSSS